MYLGLLSFHICHSIALVSFTAFLSIYSYVSYRFYLSPNSSSCSNISVCAGLCVQMFVSLHFRFSVTFFLFISYGVYISPSFSRCLCISAFLSFQLCVCLSNASVCTRLWIQILLSVHFRFSIGRFFLLFRSLDVRTCKPSYLFSSAPQ